MIIITTDDVAQTEHNIPFSSSFMISCDFSKSVRLNLYRRQNLLSASSGSSSADAAALLLLLLL